MSLVGAGLLNRILPYPATRVEQSVFFQAMLLGLAALAAGVGAQATQTACDVVATALPAGVTCTGAASNGFELHFSKLLKANRPGSGQDLFDTTVTTSLAVKPCQDVPSMVVDVVNSSPTADFSRTMLASNNKQSSFPIPAAAWTFTSGSRTTACTCLV